MVNAGPASRGYLTQPPPRLAVHPELTADDVRWLNDQLALTERPSIRYAREMPRPPVAVIYSA